MSNFFKQRSETLSGSSEDLLLLWSFLTVDEESLGFGLFVGQTSDLKTSDFVKKKKSQCCKKKVPKSNDIFLQYYFGEHERLETFIHEEMHFFVIYKVTKAVEI